MSTGICLLLYGVALTWAGPSLLTRVTRAGLAPRLAVAVWITAIAMAFGVWLVVGVGLAGDLAAGRPDVAPVEYCLRMVAALVDAGALGRLTAIAAGAVALVVSVIVAHRIILALRSFRLRSRNHARDARTLASSTRGAEVVVVQAEQPAAYCVAGRPHAIVLTTGALAALDQSALAAVLAHERAHLAGRHLQLMMLLRALATSMPRLPLFRVAVESVGRLVEMCADDAAARQHGRTAVLSGLLALAGQPRATGGSLAAADTAALDRVLRLAVPPRRGPRLRERAQLSLTIAAVVLAPLLVTGICQV